MRGPAAISMSVALARGLSAHGEACGRAACDQRHADLRAADGLRLAYRSGRTCCTPMSSSTRRGVGRYGRGAMRTPARHPALSADGRAVAAGCPGSASLPLVIHVGGSFYFKGESEGRVWPASA